MSSAELWYEDLVPGRVFDLGTTVVDGGEMRDFARRYDPPWYHVDEERAAASEDGGLSASGWLTAALWMRLYADAVLARADAHAAPGVEELRWLATVHAGDVLRGRLEVLGRDAARSRCSGSSTAGRFRCCAAGSAGGSGSGSPLSPRSDRRARPWPGAARPPR
jgi:acyl dehydratase